MKKKLFSILLFVFFGIILLVPTIMLMFNIQVNNAIIEPHLIGLQSFVALYYPSLTSIGLASIIVVILSNIFVFIISQKRLVKNN